MRRDRRRYLAYEVLRLRRAGQSKRAIARSLRISRDTIDRLLDEIQRRREEPESALEREMGPPRAPKASKIDPYEDDIRGWLDKFPKLRARRCLEMLTERGFRGGYTIVRERLSALRLELRPPPPKATPFETAPGQRAEFDWSPYRLSEELRVQLFNAQLRWSRAPSLCGATDSKQTTTMRSLQAAFEKWGGVPWECLTDTMPGVVNGWEGGEPILNARFVDFAAHYDFAVLAAPPASPQWKAVAERLFLFHETNFLDGRTFRTLSEYGEGLACWEREKALAKNHPQTGRPVREMLELERPHLKPLPARPYDTRDVVVRVIDDYQRVHLETNHYPVPAPVGSRVYVCADVERIEVCDQKARRLIEHQRLPNGARIKLDPPHVRRVRYDLDELVERLAAWGAVGEDFARAVRENRRYAGPELVRLLQLQVAWSIDDILDAMGHAIAYRCYEVSKLIRILEMRASPRSLDDQIGDLARRRIREVMDSHPVSQRPLSEYEALRHGDQPRPSQREEEHEEPRQEERDD